MHLHCRADVASFVPEAVSASEGAGRGRGCWEASQPLGDPRRLPMATLDGLSRTTRAREVEQGNQTSHAARRAPHAPSTRLRAAKASSRRLGSRELSSLRPAAARGQAAVQKCSTRQLQKLERQRKPSAHQAAELHGSLENERVAVSSTLESQPQHPARLQMCALGPL